MRSWRSFFRSKRSILIGSLALLLLSMGAALCIGVVTYTPAQLFKLPDILRYIRFPRVIAAMFAGAELAGAGVIIQTLLGKPTTYLDIAYQLMLMELLTEWKQQGKTVIMVLHDLEQALRYSDRIIAIDEKKDLCIGSPEEILGNGTLSRIFRVDIRRSEYTFERKRPHCKSSEAGIREF